MKPNNVLILLFSTAVFFSACNKDEEKIDTVWKEANEAAFAKIAANSEYTKLESQSKNGFVMYRSLKTGAGTARPKFTDIVKVYMKGWYKYYDWNKGDAYYDSDDLYRVNKIVFAADTVMPVRLAASSQIDGFTTALQYMVAGDKWEIWIPWKLGYGSSATSSSSIPAYTTLVFELELKEIE